MKTDYLVITESVPVVYSSILQGPKVLQEASNHLHKLRSIKSAAEINCMRLAGKYSGRAFNDVIARSFSSEHDLAACFEYKLQRHGCEKSAYVPVVAAGNNGNCIHYTLNCDTIKQSDLILVDGGGMVSSYVTDITRCWPADKIYSSAQTEIYEALLDVQEKIIDQCYATNDVSFADLQYFSEYLLQLNLRNVGIDISDRDIQLVYPHSIGHRIGLEVHDCRSLRTPTEPLRENETITVEPGVYFDPENERWPKWARGIAVRIEDSIAIGKGSPIILSADAVKHVSDIEALRKIALKGANET